VLVDVSAVSARTTILGREIAMPAIVAPVAFQLLAHPDGECGMARAAAAAGTIMCLSTIATTGPADVAAAAPRAPRWFQLYCFRDRGVTRALLDEAIDNGFEAIALTVDAPRAGHRERDFRTGFRADATAPAVAAAVGSDAALTPAEVFALMDPAVDWAELERLASECSVPVLVKGLVRGDDAELAVEHGASGIVVSNHGGRQLDGAPATLDALAEVVEAVDGRAEVLMDGGIRRGTDVVMALALGARAVLVGRPALWGLAVDGEAGAQRVLELLRDEIELALALCGCASPEAVTADLVRFGP
jgi:isopentenyl diphosphate isomerase/L-lactate dehydrogenase-like FMN-dependent dehydrogenase